MSLPAPISAAILILVLVVSTDSQDQSGDYSDIRQELRRKLEPLFQKVGSVVELDEKIRRLQENDVPSGTGNEDVQPTFRSASSDQPATFRSADEASTPAKKENEPFFRSMFEKGMYSLVGSQQDPNRRQPRIKEKRLVRLLTDFLNVPRFFQGARTNIWSKILLKEFFQYGLDAFIQDPMESLQWAADSGRMFTYAPIANVVAYLPGKNVGTTSDQIIAITGHYDTHPNRTGLNDNASGISVMLEIARTLTESECEFDNTVMFVQLDQEEIGLLGSGYFVERFLVPKMIAERANFQGAYNLDTIMNYNSAPHSQRIPDGIKKFAPELVEKIKKTNFKGDFMLIQGRRGLDDRLGQALINNWRKLEKPKFKMYYMSAPEEKVTKEEFQELFKRGDHWSFWKPDPKIYNGTFSAVEVADTVDDRGIMKTCYHQMCDDDIHMMNPKNVYFIKKLGDAIIGALLDLGKGKCKKGLTRKEILEKRKKILAAKAPASLAYTMSASLTDEEPSSTPEEPQLEGMDFPPEAEPVRKTKKTKTLDEKIEKALLSAIKIKNRAGWKKDARTLLPEFRSKMQFLSNSLNYGKKGDGIQSGGSKEVKPQEPKAVEPQFHSARNSKYRSRDRLKQPSASRRNEIRFRKRPTSYEEESSRSPSEEGEEYAETDGSEYSVEPQRDGIVLASYEDEYTPTAIGGIEVYAEAEDSDLYEKPEWNGRLNSEKRTSESLLNSEDGIDPEILERPFSKENVFLLESPEIYAEIETNEIPRFSQKNFATSVKSPPIRRRDLSDADSSIINNSGISSPASTSQSLFNFIAYNTDWEGDRKSDVSDNEPSIFDFPQDNPIDDLSTTLEDIESPAEEDSFQEDMDFGEDNSEDFPNFSLPPFESDFDKDDDPFRPPSVNTDLFSSSLSNLQFPTLEENSFDVSSDFGENDSPSLTWPTGANEIFSSNFFNTNSNEDFTSPFANFHFPVDKTKLEKSFSNFPTIPKLSFPEYDFNFGKGQLLRRKREMNLYQYADNLQPPTQNYENLYNQNIQNPNAFHNPFEASPDINIERQNYPEQALESPPIYYVPNYYAPYFSGTNALQEPLTYPEHNPNANILDYFPQPMPQPIPSRDIFQSVRRRNERQPDFIPNPPQTYYPQNYINSPQTKVMPEFHNDYQGSTSLKYNVPQGTLAKPYFMSARSAKRTVKGKKKGKKKTSLKNKEKNNHFFKELLGVLSTKLKNKGTTELKPTPSWKQGKKDKKRITKGKKPTNSKYKKSPSEKKKPSELKGGKRNATRVNIQTKGEKAFKEIVSAFKEDLLPKDSKLPKNFQLSVEVKSKPDEKKDGAKRKSYFKKTVSKAGDDDANVQSHSSSEESSHFESSSSDGKPGDMKDMDMNFEDSKMSAHFDDDATFGAMDKSDDWGDDFGGFMKKKKQSNPVILSDDEPEHWKRRKPKKKPMIVIIKQPPERFRDDEGVPEEVPNWMKMITDEADKYLTQKTEPTREEEDVPVGAPSWMTMIKEEADKYLTEKSEPTPGLRWMTEMKEDAEEYLKTRKKIPKKIKKKKKWVKKKMDDEEDSESAVPSWMKTMTDVAKNYLDKSPPWMKKRKVRPKKPMRRRPIKKKKTNRFNAEQKKMLEQLREKMRPNWPDEDSSWNEQPQENSDNFWLSKMKSEFNRRQNFERDETPQSWSMETESSQQWRDNDEENDMSDFMNKRLLPGDSSDYDTDMSQDNFNEDSF